MAGWYGSSGQAKVTLSTEPLLADGTSLNGNNAMSFVVDPEAKLFGSCAPSVADTTVVIGSDGIVTITV
jgi:hypothetical protein